ncbi:MAG TPA: hypothetical protein V6C96_04290 [Vampirovibrionales bacterium]
MKVPAFFVNYKRLVAILLIITCLSCFGLGKLTGQGQELTAADENIIFVVVLGLFLFIIHSINSNFSTALEKHISDEVNKQAIINRKPLFNIIDSIKSTVGLTQIENGEQVTLELDQFKEVFEVTIFDMKVMPILSNYLRKDKKVLNLIEQISEREFQNYSIDPYLSKLFINDIFNCMTWLELSFRNQCPSIIQRDSFNDMTQALKEGLPYGLSAYQATLNAIKDHDAFQKLIMEQSPFDFLPISNPKRQKSTVLDKHINFLIYELKKFSEL